MTRRQDYPSPREVVSFEDWLQMKYGNPAPGEDFVYDDNWPGDEDDTKPTYAEYTVWTWEEPEILVSKFSLDQIGNTFWHEEDIYVDLDLPRELRNRAWSALPTLFRELFARYCSPVLGHLNESDKGTQRLDGACYMWWDKSMYYPKSPRVTDEDNDAFLKVCELCLEIPHPTVQESALHGLGHAQRYRQVTSRVEAIIDHFLSQGNITRVELVKYAKSARTGSVQ
ncbi:MAG: hypothetical protein K8R88_07750 [Armatimonadetes bacterium]|nr:hypothetical protein [Armatimonadota bacterium]